MHGAASPRAKITSPGRNARASCRKKTWNHAM
jgi:hypothetical protein